MRLVQFPGVSKIGEGFSGFKSPAFGGGGGSMAEALTAFAEKEKDAVASGISG